MRICATDAFKLVRVDIPVEVSPLEIWLVDGNSIRTELYIDFIGGGHHYVYDFIPLNDIWIDIDTGDVDTIFYAVHELAERAWMKRGMPYEDAHERANQVERVVRHDPTKINDVLEQLAQRNRGVVPAS